MAQMIVDGVTLPLDRVNRTTLIQQLGLATGLIQTGTTTSAATDYIIDTNLLKSQQYSPSEWTGGWCRISNISGHAAPEGDYRPIKNYDPETGTIYVDPVFSGNPGASASYELWKIEPQRVLDMIDQSLQNDLYIPCLTTLSELDDYDMEQTGTSSWTAGNSATLTKISSGTTTTEHPFQSGGRFLSVAAGATANAYAESLPANVEPGRTYHASALLWCGASGTNAKLQVWDNTNGAEIQSASMDRLYPGRLYYIWQAPSTCYQVTYRLITTAANKTTYWDEVVGYCVSSGDISLPWWVKNRQQVKAFFRMVPRTTATITTSNNQLWDPALTGEVDYGVDILENFSGLTRFRGVWRNGIVGSFPYFILGIRNETAYSDNNTDYKYIDIPYFLSCLKYKVYQYLSRTTVSANIDRTAMLQDMAQAQLEWNRYAYQQEERLEKTIRSPDPMMGVLDDRFRYGG